MNKLVKITQLLFIAFLSAQIFCYADTETQINLGTTNTRMDEGIKKVSVGNIYERASGDEKYVYVISIKVDLVQSKGNKKITKLGEYIYNLYAYEPENEKNAIELETGFMFLSKYWPSEVQGQTIQSSLKLELASEDIGKLDNIFNSNLSKQVSDQLLALFIQKMDEHDINKEQEFTNALADNINSFVKVAMENSVKWIPPIIEKWPSVKNEIYKQEV